MSSLIPESLSFTKDHEWTDKKGDFLTVGITDFAQSSLGDIVFLELPEVGTNLDKGAAFGVVESIKSVSDLYSPISGEVVEVNSDLVDSPEKINENPYESWMIKIKFKDEAELSDLLDANNYQSHVESL